MITKVNTCVSSNMFKKIFLGVLLFFSGTLYSQMVTPVEWGVEVEEVSSSEFNLIFNAKIEPHWHLYSQHSPEGGALPTVFTFSNAGTDYELVGETEESEAITDYDKVFEMNLTYFEDKARFVQRIRLLNQNVSTILAEIEYKPVMMNSVFLIVPKLISSFLKIIVLLRKLQVLRTVKNHQYL